MSIARKLEVLSMKAHRGPNMEKKIEIYLRVIEGVLGQEDWAIQFLHRVVPG